MVYCLVLRVLLEQINLNMKKALLASLSLLLLVFAKAQFTVDPGVWKIITIENRTYRIFVPSDYTTGSNYYFHVAFWVMASKAALHSVLRCRENGLEVPRSGTEVYI